MKLGGLLVLMVLISCEGLRPETVDVTAYPEVGKLLDQDYLHLHNKELSKTAILNNQEETKAIRLDSGGWVKELTFLEEIDPNQSKYVGAFKITEDEKETQLLLKEGERGSLKAFSFFTVNDEIAKVLATIHEDKDVYVHHKKVEVLFANGVIAEYAIKGYQKIMTKDTFFFEVRGKVY